MSPDAKKYVSVRLVKETTQATSFVVDGIASPEDGSIGVPIALVLGRPETLWFDAAVERLLGDWVEHSELVQLDVRSGRRGPVAVLQCHGTSLRADLVAVA